ncbi:restriction of telomere capping protein 4 [Zychaea mexicana]|uniref:restriction of telomere capping protein 4 n=1 Tax=Zychaea mexicana TaxID=64656 RepID=UPI0022FE59EF|nr:restriction of telomere capping protein 4 [Zychaea mexicana]KAI9489991.1 restriction of telomere capping protein 4 [Zychaea mexicana]
MQDIIVGKTESRFKSMETEFYCQHSRSVARSVFARMARAEKSLSGYYGPRGMQIIMDCLTKELSKSNHLTAANTAPMPPLQCVQQILVPETAARLIQEDKNVSYDEALKIMKKSAKFGSAVNPTMDSDESESSDE